MEEWYVVYTQPSKEEFAKSELINQGYHVYIPRYKKICKHARKTYEVMAPLFPRYVFIGIDPERQRWRSVNGTRGVVSLLTIDQIPAKVPSALIDDLKAQELDGGLLSLACLTAFTQGEKVLITSGSFQGQIAVFEKMSDHERAQLLIDFLGKKMSVNMPAHHIQAA